MNSKQITGGILSIIGIIGLMFKEDIAFSNFFREAGFESLQSCENFVFILSIILVILGIYIVINYSESKSKNYSKNSILQKLGLVQVYEIEFKVSKQDFITTLNNNIDQPQSILSIGSKSQKNIYNGIVHNDRFELKKTRKLFDRRKNYTKVSGKILERNNNLIVEVEFNGFQGYYMYFCSAFFILYLVILIISQIDANNNREKATIIKLLSLMFLLFYVFFYFQIKKGVDQLKNNFEHDLHQIIEKSN